MDDFYMEYLRTRNSGEYDPKRVITCLDESGKVLPVFREATVHMNGKGLEIERQMIVNNRRFIVRSIFSSADGETPTKRMLRIIENDLEKDLN